MKTLRRIAGAVVGQLRTVPAVNRWYARTRSRLYERTIAGVRGRRHKRWGVDNAGPARFPAAAVFKAIAERGLRQRK